MGSEEECLGLLAHMEPWRGGWVQKRPRCGMHKQDTAGPREAPMVCIGVGVGSRKEDPSANYVATVSRTSRATASISCPLTPHLSPYTLLTPSSFLSFLRGFWYILTSTPAPLTTSLLVSIVLFFFSCPVFGTCSDVIVGTLSSTAVLPRRGNTKGIWGVGTKNQKLLCRRSRAFRNN